MRRALVYGANGALGRAMTAALKTRSGTTAWTSYGVDIEPCEGADKSIIVPKGLPYEAESNQVVSQVQDVLGAPSHQLDAVICVNGGFALASAKDRELFATVQSMYGSSVFPSFVAAHLASLYLKKGGLLVLPGAVVGGSTPTPWGLSYGSAKAAVHHMVRSLGSDPSASGLDGSSKVVGFAPVTLDTPGNREAMPDADRSTWTPLPVLADKLRAWAEDPTVCESGVVYKVTTTDGQKSTVMEPME